MPHQVIANECLIMSIGLGGNDKISPYWQCCFGWTAQHAWMCTKSQGHLVAFSPANHSPGGVIDGSFTGAISPKNPPLSLLSSKGLVLFQTSMSAGFHKRDLHSGPPFACALWISAHGALSAECQALKALAEIWAKFFFSSSLSRALSCNSSFAFLLWFNDHKAK